MVNTNKEIPDYPSLITPKDGTGLSKIVLIRAE
jgi:hypothetical protein